MHLLDDYVDQTDYLPTLRKACVTDYKKPAKPRLSYEVFASILLVLALCASAYALAKYLKLTYWFYFQY